MGEEPVLDPALDVVSMGLSRTGSTGFSTTGSATLAICGSRAGAGALAAPQLEGLLLEANFPVELGDSGALSVFALAASNNVVGTGRGAGFSSAFSNRSLACAAGVALVVAAAVQAGGAAGF
jgi:hypothetical protein